MLIEYSNIFEYYSTPCAYNFRSFAVEYKAL